MMGATFHVVTEWCWSLPQRGVPLAELVVRGLLTLLLGTTELRTRGLAVTGARLHEVGLLRSKSLDGLVDRLLVDIDIRGVILVLLEDDVLTADAANSIVGIDEPGLLSSSSDSAVDVGPKKTLGQLLSLGDRGSSLSFGALEVRLLGVLLGLLRLAKCLELLVLLLVGSALLLERRLQPGDIRLLALVAVRAVTSVSVAIARVT